MYLKKQTMTSTENYFWKIKKLKEKISETDFVIIGAGAGLSASAGFTYSGERFDKYFSDFKERYGITDIYSGGFYPFDTLEEYWAWWSRHILINRYVEAENTVYSDLFDLIKNKDYFVLTTNVDHCFQKAGFNKHRLFYTQGDYGLFQCSKACHNKTYDNEQTVKRMIKEQSDMKIPKELIPYCPVCKAPMTVNLRSDDTFVQDDGWYKASMRYEDFLRRSKGLNVLFFELGVGYNTPGIIKFPFWQMTMDNKNAVFASINLREAYCPERIKNQAVCINGDIGKVLKDLLKA